MKSVRKVTFNANEKNIREFSDENMQEDVRDVERVTDTLVQFLQKTVKENIYHLGQHYKGYDNDDKSYADVFEHQYNKISKSVLQSSMHELDGVYETMLDFLDEPTASLFRSLFEMKDKNAIEYKRLRWCAIIVMLIGLGSFLEYGHCLNKCADALIYYKDRDEIRFSYWGIAAREFADICLSSHRTIEDAMGWDDLRDLDDILQEASHIARKGAKACSLTFPTADVPKHSLGPLSGTKSKIVSTSTRDEKTIYTTRRGVNYTMNPSGLLEKN